MEATLANDPVTTDPTSATTAVTPTNELFVEVTQDLRGAPRGRWGEIVTKLQDPNATVFVPGRDEANKAKGSLTQSFRHRGMKLKSKTTTINGQVGIVFWAVPKV